MLARLLRLWFSFAEPVDRKTYALHGFGLMALKYAIDSALVWRFAGKFWTPLDYLNPLWSTRVELFGAAPLWLPPLLVALTLPFLWIGVSMTMRRAVHAGFSPWTCLLFFVPVVNYVSMLYLCFAPPAAKVVWPATEPPRAPRPRHRRPVGGAAHPGRCRSAARAGPGLRGPSHRSAHT